MMDFKLNRKFYNEIPKSNINYSGKKTPEMNQEEITPFIKEFNTMHNIKDAYEYIDNLCASNSDFQELDLNLFKYKDYYIRTGKAFNLNPHIENLKKINDLGIKCAPKLVAPILLKNNEDMILITKIADSSDVNLTQYNQVKGDINLSAKQEFIDDFNILAKEGFYNPTIIDSTKNWFVVPKTNRIYIDDWSHLSRFENEKEKNSLRNLLGQMCGLIY